MPVSRHPSTAPGRSAASTSSGAASASPADADEMDVPKLALFTTAYSLVEGLLTYPYDVLKTRLQVAAPRSREARLGTWGMLHSAIRRGRPEELYRGFRWNVLGGVPSEVAYYVSYTTAKRALLRTQFGQDHPSTVFATAAVVAEASSVALWVPIDVISQRLMLQKSARPPDASAISSAGASQIGVSSGGDAPTRVVPRRERTGMQIASSIVRAEGLPGLWRGTHVTLLALAPSSIAWWLTHEHAKERASAKFGLPTEHALVLGFSGALAGVAQTVVTNPLDVVKTRLQTSEAALPAMRVLRGVLSESGWLGLYSGLFPRLVAAVPRSVCTVVAYERAIEYCRRMPASASERGGGGEGWRWWAR